MHLAFSKIIGLPIFELRDQNQLGRISDLIFQDDLKIIAFVINTGGFFDKPMILFTDEIIEFSKDAAIVNQEESISSLDESVRIKKMIENKQIGVKHPVVDTEKNNIGRCNEIIFTGDTFQISRIHVSSWFGEKIFEMKNIKGFKEGKFVVNKSDSKIRSKMVAEDSIAG